MRVSDSSFSHINSPHFAVFSTEPKQSGMRVSFDSVIFTHVRSLHQSSWQAPGIGAVISIANAESFSRVSVSISNVTFKHVEVAEGTIYADASSGGGYVNVSQARIPLPTT